MPKSPTLLTFRDPALSLWQSTVHSTLMSHQAQGNLAQPLTSTAGGLAATADHPFMIASNQAMNQLQSTPATVPQLTAAAAGVGNDILQCAKLAAEIAWDEVFD